MAPAGVMATRKPLTPLLPVIQTLRLSGAGATPYAQNGSWLVRV